MQDIDTAHCPRWRCEETTQDSMLDMWRRISAVYLAEIRPLAAGRGTRVMPQRWHSRVFDGLPPIPYYAGNYRQFDPDKPCLCQDVIFGNSNWKGVDKRFVRGTVARFLFKLTKGIEILDKSSNTTPGQVEQIQRQFLFVAWAVAEFIKIHPFLNGNGRISRLIANFLLLRFQFRPMQEYPRPQHVLYIDVLDQALRGNYSPLRDYFLMCAYPPRQSN